MRISEILFWDNKPIEGNYSDPHLDLPKAPSSDFFTKLASDYAKDELLKRFWNGKRSEISPSVPASPDAGIELIPSDTLEPTPGYFPRNTKRMNICQG
jgi:hypothetical protein